ncbi:MAG: peptide chain release factor 1 [Candidatus Omnitrophica bacterium]|nr:peptide chain release factor 1 [Candidatus Omnitrophota bacterium]MBU1997212.1 peptide chain release factor 1 [Candidatus Omnitrophota bacterium]MBU4334079.1 peptide chain release factor 1 [Candidatus Omnitrophota bacterium]
MNLEKYETIKSRFAELEQLLADPNVISDKIKYQKIAKEYSDLTPVVAIFSEYKESLNQLNELETLLCEKQDKAFEELAEAEKEDLKARQVVLIAKLDDLTNPKKQSKDRNLIFEIRAGTGGQEASLFAADLYRMYTKFAEKKGWKVEQISCNESEAGGFKEVIFSMSGSGAEKYLKWESGAHRVQRVPATETSGRIHTSAATVAVLFEPEEVELNIDPKDLKTDVFRSSGPGGQSVNTTDSAIRITHLPTGIVVICQDERSQLKNKHKAMRVLRARMLERIERENSEKETKDRKLKVGSGDRSEKIRTYNFPDRRITDHRIGFTTYRLQNVLDGELDELCDALIKADMEERAQ